MLNAPANLQFKKIPSEFSAWATPLQRYTIRGYNYGFELWGEGIGTKITLPNFTDAVYIAEEIEKCRSAKKHRATDFKARKPGTRSGHRLAIKAGHKYHVGKNRKGE